MNCQMDFDKICVKLMLLFSFYLLSILFFIKSIIIIITIIIVIDFFV